jgi:hypothetical protein
MFLCKAQDKTYMQIQSFLSDPVTRENHSMLLQLVATMGHIISACEAWFREEGMSRVYTEPAFSFLNEQVCYGGYTSAEYIWALFHFVYLRNTFSKPPFKISLRSSGFEH